MFMKIPLADPLIGEDEAKAVYSILKGSKDKLMEMLDSAGIQTRIYFLPAHKTPMMKKYGYKADSLKKMEEVANTILSLPSSLKLTEDDIAYISEIIHKIIGDCRL